jgi:four helix bundle protein
MHGQISLARAIRVAGLEIAYGSARELQYEVALSARLGYLDEKAAKHLDYECTALARALNGLLRALR